MVQNFLFGSLALVLASTVLTIRDSIRLYRLSSDSECHLKLRAVFGNQALGSLGSSKWQLFLTQTKGTLSILSLIMFSQGTLLHGWIYLPRTKLIVTVCLIMRLYKCYSSLTFRPIKVLIYQTVSVVIGTLYYFISHIAMFAKFK
jgi:hypothetical protein